MTAQFCRTFSTLPYRARHTWLPTGQRRVRTAIELCRSAALGGQQIEGCDQCCHGAPPSTKDRASADTRTFKVRNFGDRLYYSRHDRG
ncbi:hypothetical protein CN210_33740 [Sinorhizobium meliloti]|nr:hypothetical protein CN210_33740 [Sinorhizobium meliloti]